MVVLEATVDESQVQSELEQIDDPQVDVEGELAPGPGFDGGGDGEAVGQLAQIGRRLTLILGALGVLSQLDTVLEILDGIFRALEVALLPLIGLITAFLRPVLQRLLRLFADFSFDQAFAQLEQVIGDIVDDVGGEISQELNQLAPDFIGSNPMEIPDVTTRSEIADLGEQTFGSGSPIGRIFNFASEFSNAGLQNSLSNNSEENQSEDSPGGGNVY
jgi:hypothetical protein